MVESKFRLWVMLPSTIVIILLSATIFFATRTYSVLNPDTPAAAIIFFSVLYIYFLTYLLFGELRAKAIKICIADQTITKRGYIGLGIKHTYQLEEITGYLLSNISSRNGTYEYLYLIVKGRKVVKLSEFYHQNYSSLKKALINRNIKYLGIEYWSFIKETKEIFS